MYEIHIITKEMDRIIYHNITQYNIEDNYIFMKNSSNYIFYCNRDIIREIKIKKEVN